MLVLEVGLQIWDCCPTPVLYSQWPNLFMLLNERKKKANYFFLFFFLLWRFSPRLNSKFALVWLQKKKKKDFFATETWTICASKRLRMGEFQIIKSEVCLQVKNWECVQSLFSFIWAKIKTHSLEQSCCCLFCGETFLFEGCGEWMNVHNKTDKIF